MLEFKNVYKYFDGKCVLNNLSFKIKENAINFIIGYSGTGKSLSIKNILGLDSPDEGQICFQGEDITKFSKKQMINHRLNIGVLFQNIALLDSLNIFENIILPLKENFRLSQNQIDQKFKEIASIIDIEDIKFRYPNQISVAEQKKAGLARAIISFPKLILYDEPTTAMDPLISDMIDKLILKVSKIREDITSIVVSHDIKSILSVADNIIMLHEGSLILEGSPEKIKESDNPILQNFFKGISKT